MPRTLRSFLLATAMLAAAPAMAAEKPLTKSDVEQIVKEYISNNPKEIFGALQAAEAKMRADEFTKQKEALKSSEKALLNDPDSPVAGNPNGDVTLVEFYDYNCGYCKRMLPIISDLIGKDKNVRVVLKDFPILHPTSQQAAHAAIAVNRIDKSKDFAFHSELMKHNGQLTEQAILETATKVGLDADKVKAEMNKPEVEAIVRKNLELGAAIGVQGTPAFVINGELIPGATDLKTLETMVAKARAAKKN